MKIKLRYGAGEIEFAAPNDTAIIGKNLPDNEPELTAKDFGELLDNRTSGPPFKTLFQPEDKITIIVSDNTRYSAANIFISEMQKRLPGSFGRGIEKDSLIKIVIANGTHRAMADDELRNLVGVDVYDSVEVVNHDCDNESQLVDVGGVKVNRLVVECDKLILTGSCGLHYLAGYGGGRKGIMPGVVSRADAEKFHFLSLNNEGPGRHPNIGTGILAGNHMSEYSTEVMRKISPIFMINTILDRHGKAVAAAAGAPEVAFEAAVNMAKERSVVSIEKKYDLVIASCGGAPKDINFIQAHKAFDNSVRALSDNGKLFLMAEAPDGIGSDSFQEWFSYGGWRDIDKALRPLKNFKINGQTAMATREKSEKWEVLLLSTLDPDMVKRMGIRPAESKEAFIKEVESELKKTGNAAFFPEAGFILPS